MPVLLPAPKPRFSCSIRRASGNRSRTSSTVPSVEPWSTTIVSCPRTLSRQRSIHGTALYVTTTTETRESATEPAEALPPEQQRSRERQAERDGEEQEPGREGLVGAHAQPTEEADEERLAHGDPVDRERHQQDEEEQRAHHVVGPWREVDPDRLTREPDRQHAHRLHGERQREDAEQEARMVAKAVDPLVGSAKRLLEPDPAQQRHRER